MTFKFKLDLANLKMYLHNNTCMYHHATFQGVKLKQHKIYKDDLSKQVVRENY